MLNLLQKFCSDTKKESFEKFSSLLKICTLFFYTKM